MQRLSWCDCVRANRSWPSPDDGKKRAPRGGALCLTTTARLAAVGGEILLGHRTTTRPRDDTSGGGRSESDGLTIDARADVLVLHSDQAGAITDYDRLNVSCGSRCVT